MNGPLCNAKQSVKTNWYYKKIDEAHSFNIVYFHFSLRLILDNLCTKIEILNFFLFKIRDLYLRAFNDQEWVIMAGVLKLASWRMVFTYLILHISQILYKIYVINKKVADFFVYLKAIY